MTWLASAITLLTLFAAANIHDAHMSLAAVRARHAAIDLAGRVAVVVGGTSGIGAGIATRLAAGDASVVLVGRSKERADEVLAQMRAVSKTAVHSFVACDASLLSSIPGVVTEFQKQHGHLDYLVLTQGIATVQGRTETREGLDVKMSLHYYSRVAFAEKFAPLMKPGSRVLTVLSAGVHSPYAGFATEPELKTSYSLSNAANSAGFYNDIAVQALAAEHPGIAYVHAAPGVVNTNWSGAFIKQLACACLDRPRGSDYLSRLVHASPRTRFPPFPHACATYFHAYSHAGARSCRWCFAG